MRKNIRHLMVDNVRVTEHADKAMAVDGFFESLFGTETGRPFSLDLAYWRYPSMELQQIDGVFTEDKV
jgi:hypothetical protein